MRFGEFFSVALLVCLLTELTHGQEIVKGTEKTSFAEVRVSPDNNQILALPIGGEKTTSPDDEALCLFDVTKQVKHVVYKNNRDRPDSMAFTPSGRELVGGGRCFFGGWKTKTLDYLFQYKGRPDDLSSVTVSDLTPAKRAEKIVYTETRSSIPDGIDMTQCKLIVWNIPTGRKDDAQILSSKKNELLRFRIAYAGSGSLLAHWNSVTKEVVVHDVSDRPFKELAAFNLKLKQSTELAFSPDEKTLWVRIDLKLQEFNIATKEKMRSVEVADYAGWFHILGDSSLMIHEQKQGNSVGLRFVDPDGKKDKRVLLEPNIWFPTVSPDESVFAASGVKGGIYLCNVSELRKKAK